MNVQIRSLNGSFTVGPGSLVRVMALVGTSSSGDYSRQCDKLDALCSMENGPDIIADLSIVPTTKPLWQIVLEAGFTASTLPIYTTTRKGSVVDPEELLEIALTQMEAGVGLLTIHPTATREIISATDKRLTPWTSRGGGIVIRDLLARDSNENVYSVILPDLINAAKKYGAALSIGASFRSANIFDSRDTAQLGEIEAQIRIANIISAQGVGVIIESPGHARPIDIQLTARQLAATGIPIMPLGPIPTDAAVGFDHVAAAIGATIMGMEGAAHVLAAVTREEHTGGIPSVESTIEAVRSARVAAHIIGIHRLGLTQIDAGIVNERVKHRTCVAGKQTHGCSRCGPVCPL